MIAESEAYEDRGQCRLRGRKLLAAMEQITEDMDGLYAVLPAWVVLEPALRTEVCGCGCKADYVVVGPDYPYCVACLRKIHD